MGRIAPDSDSGSDESAPKAMASTRERSMGRSVGRCIGRRGDLDCGSYGGVPCEPSGDLPASSPSTRVGAIHPPGDLLS